MKYTKEQLQGMSDDKVNRALFVIIMGSDVSLAVKVYDLLQCKPSYCNNPSDIMPLAFDHGISSILEVNDSEWTAYHELYIEFEAWESSQSYSDKNPLRAIVCCLILVLQDKQ